MADNPHQSVLRSGAFRFALIFAAVFAIGSFLLLTSVDRQIASYGLEATDNTLRSEAANMTAEYRELGLSGLTDAIARRSAAGDDPQFRYRLLDAAGRHIAGDLPSGAPLTGWGVIAVREGLHAAGAGDQEQFKTLGTTLPSGLHLIVATDTFDIRELSHRLNRFTLLCGIGITLFALVGGYFVGGLFVRRLDRVNSSVARIMSGALSERLPAIGISPEFDTLSHNLNLMLDRIGALMDGLRQVSTDIAHDLRTPLTRLRQQLEDTRETESREEHQQGIDTAIEQIDEILAIFRALMRIGTLEGGAGRSRLAPVDLSEIAERVYQAYQPVVEDGGRELAADLAVSLHIRGDAELLAQMIVNLIENAISHTPPGTLIRMSLVHADREVVLTIDDDGPGIPQDEHEKVLVRFYRMDRSRSTPGAGLGLSLVGAIVGLHEGRLMLSDNDPGLRVTVTLPAAADASRAAATGSNIAPQP